MTAENSTEWLIDLLYKEEDAPTPDAESASSALEAVQQAEFDAISAMMGEVRAAMPLEEPGATVRASIMAAAQKQAESSAARAASSTGMRAPGNGRSGQSIWSSQTMHRAMSFAAVLCVLVGAGVFATNMSSTTYQSKFSEASSGVASEVRFDSPAESEAAPAIAAAQESLDFPELQKTQDTPTLSDDALPIENTLALQRKQDRGAGIMDERATMPSPRRVTRSVAKKEPAYKSESLSGLTGWDKARNAAPRKEAGPSQAAPPSSPARELKLADLDDISSSEEEAERQAPGDSLFGSNESPSRAPKMDRKDSVGNMMAESADDFDQEKKKSVSGGDAASGRKRDFVQDSESSKESGRGEARESAAAPAPEPSVAPEQAPRPSVAAKTSAARPAPKPQEEDVEQNNTSLREVESSQRSGNASRTLEKADAYLARGIGTSREQARALELKAQALQELGREEEARVIYRKIDEQHPTYYKKENLETKKKRRSKAKSKKTSVDFSDESLEAY